MKKRQFLKNGNAWRSWRRGNNAMPSASWWLPSDKRYGRRNINGTSPGHKVHTFIEGVDILWLEMLLKCEIWYLFCNSCKDGWFGEIWTRWIRFGPTRCTIVCKCHLGKTDSSTKGSTYQSAHITTSKRPSRADTSASLSHLTTLKNKKTKPASYKPSCPIYHSPLTWHSFSFLSPLVWRQSSSLFSLSAGAGFQASKSDY